MAEAGIQLKACEHQAGGHFATREKDAATFTDGSGRFYKACQDMVRGGREGGVYELIFSDSLDEEQKAAVRTEDMVALRPFVPRYYGIVEADGKKLLALDDSCHGYQQPCVLDAKVGLSTSYDWADEKYQVKCRQKDAASTQNVLGYRVTGFRVYTHRALDYTVGDRLYGKALTPETMPECFKTFGSNGTLTPKEVYGGQGGILDQLKALEKWFTTQRSLVFYAASTILVYEGTAKSAEELKPKVRLIDFAHTYPSKGLPDNNFLPGLRSLISMLEQVVA